VRSHLKNLYRKLGVRSREQAAEAAHRLRDLVL
jgi:DNA-binding CsgD family transcriptional regulator